MKKRWTAFALGLLLVAGAWYVWSTTPEQRARGAIDELALVLRAREPRVPGQLEDDLGRMLTEQVRLVTPGATISTRPRVVDAVGRHAARYRTADVVFRNVTVDVSADGRASARAEAALLEGGDRHFDVKREVELDLRLVEGRWRIDQIRLGAEDTAAPEARP